MIDRATGIPVAVQYYKYPTTPHWRHDLTRLGEDEHGVWLGGRVGATIQRGREPIQELERALVQLIPSGKWWTALFNDRRRVQIYADVVTAPVWTAPDRVEMVDLDLDVIRLTDGTVYVDDEDEFEEHRRSLGYPPRMADTARAAAARLVLDMETHVAPFDGAWRSWLDLVT